MSRTMLPNYRLEGDIRDAAARAGALATALDDFVEDFRAYKFDEAELPEYIERCRTEKPHRFVVADPDGVQEAIEAFGPGGTSLQRRADFVKRHGVEHAEQTAKLFGTTIVSTKPGTVPEHLKTQAPGDHSRGKDNPWSSTDARGFPTVDKAGRFLPATLTRQTNLVRTLVGAHGQQEGLRRANEIARAAGCKVGDTRASRAA